MLPFSIRNQILRHCETAQSQSSATLDASILEPQVLLITANQTRRVETQPTAAGRAPSDTWPSRCNAALVEVVLPDASVALPATFFCFL